MPWRRSKPRGPKTHPNRTPKSTCRGNAVWNEQVWKIVEFDIKGLDQKTSSKKKNKKKHTSATPGEKLDLLMES
jgi:hypothetical protein